MSRIGKSPVNIPENVTVELNNNNVIVKGPQGELQQEFEKIVSINKEENKIVVKPVDIKKNKKFVNSYWGLTTKLIRNMIDGVTNGFEKKLIIEGVGYKAQAQGNKLVLTVGYSHSVEMIIPSDLKVEVKDNTNITVKGIDKYKVGQYAALIRSKRKPEPYKGKGIKYFDERIKRKVGKTGV